MQVMQTVLRQPTDLADKVGVWRDFQPQLILAFGPVHWLRALNTSLATQLAHVPRLGCTSAGEISDQGVTDETCVVTAIQFESGPCTSGQRVLGTDE